MLAPHSSTGQRTLSSSSHSCREFAFFLSSFHILSKAEVRCPELHSGALDCLMQLVALPQRGAQVLQPSRGSRIPPTPGSPTNKDEAPGRMRLMSKSEDMWSEEIGSASKATQSPPEAGAAAEPSPASSKVREPAIDF